jgi:hypothetical protein
MHPANDFKCEANRISCVARDTEHEFVLNGIILSAKIIDFILQVNYGVALFV